MGQLGDLEHVISFQAESSRDKVCQMSIWWCEAFDNDNLLGKSAQLKVDWEQVENLRNTHKFLTPKREGMTGRRDLGSKDFNVGRSILVNEIEP
jgi:hypothetical protein